MAKAFTEWTVLPHDPIDKLAHNLWRLSTGSWLERQADLRGGLDAGRGGGIWMRAIALIMKKNSAPAAAR